MGYRRIGDIIVVRLPVGEEVTQSLCDIARRERFPGAVLAALGAVNDTTLALYDPATREYRRTRFREDLEIASMVGNLAWMGDEPVVHAHGVFSRVDCTTVAGHVMRAVVSVTVELMLTVLKERIERRPDEKVGLNLLDL
ncbi:MAG: PPC domain-containing DNA-binding protein [Acidobacteriota bacterium]